MTITHSIPVETPDTSEHDAAMVALVEGNTDSLAAKTPEAPATENLILGKFKTQEDLVAAYAELEKKLGAPAETPAEPPVETQPEAETTEQPAGTLAEVLPSLNEEFATSGQLSDESYKKLETFGLPKEMVDAYIEGQKVLAERVFQNVGGKEAYSSMVSWAQNNMTPEQITSYNKAVEGSDANVRDLAISGLHAKYVAATGTKPTLLTGGNVQSTVGFASKAELVSAMSDPRYKSDAAYRKSVEDKLAVSFNN